VVLGSLAGAQPVGSSAGPELPADVVAMLEGVEGWLSDDQAQRLYERARAVAPGGTILEIGSYRGRSTIVLARAANRSVRVVAVDPHAGNDRGPQQIHGSAQEGEADRRAFEANLVRAGVAERVEHVREPSARALRAVNGDVDLLYVDGAHRLVPALGDLRGWGARVRPSGAMLVHDAFASVGVTMAILAHLVLGRSFVYVGRSRSLAEYRRVGDPLRGWARAANAGRQLAELPWFARNVAIKLALVAGLRRLAAALGHRGRDPWPY
jgi:predicted O-methyltransferase YrrM